MAAYEDERGGNGAPRWTCAYACDRKHNVELF